MSQAVRSLLVIYAQRSKLHNRESVLDICYHDSGECAIPNEDHHLERKKMQKSVSERREKKNVNLMHLQIVTRANKRSRAVSIAIPKELQY